MYKRILSVLLSISISTVPMCVAAFADESAEKKDSSMVVTVVNESAEPEVVVKSAEGEDASASTEEAVAEAENREEQSQKTSEQAKKTIDLTSLSDEQINELIISKVAPLAKEIERRRNEKVAEILKNETFIQKCKRKALGCLVGMANGGISGCAVGLAYGMLSWIIGGARWFSGPFLNPVVRTSCQFTIAGGINSLLGVGRIGGLVGTFLNVAINILSGQITGRIFPESLQKGPFDSYKDGERKEAYRWMKLYFHPDKWKSINGVELAGQYKKWAEDIFAFLNRKSI